jgi:hypothetical protein
MNVKYLLLLIPIILISVGSSMECTPDNRTDKIADMNRAEKHTEPAALVCNLSDKELVQRLQYLRGEIFSPNKVSDLIPLEAGYKYIYNQPVDFSLKLVEFINFERKCCPSFRFAIEFEPEEGPIALKIYGSEQIRDLLTSMIESSELRELL